MLYAALALSLSLSSSLAAGDPGPSFAAPFASPGALPVVAVDAGHSGALPVVAIDAGHGGTQPGALGVCGLQEKNVTLAIASELGKLLAASGRVTPLLTRTGDETVTLDDRALRANRGGAALFVSVHANASLEDRSRGFETYFLSRHAADQRLAQIARLENDGSELVDEPTDTVSRILGGLRMQASHDASQRLAMLVQQTLGTQLGHFGRGVLQAPFIVLRKADMAAVLVEVGFLTYEDECKELAQVDYQRRVARALATAVLAHLSLTKQPQPTASHGAATPGHALADRR